MRQETQDNRQLTVTLSERSREILKTIVKTYLGSAEPVGSRVVAKKAGLGLSPATIRNAMADLEEVGLLYQPHTSAGRIPTEEGLRYYVSELMEKEDLSWGDQIAIEKGLLASSEDMSQILKKAVELLASFTGHAAVISAPKPDSESLVHIEFVRIRPAVVLVISVYENGLVQNRVLRLDTDISDRMLSRLSDYINKKLSSMAFDEVRTSIIQEMEDDKRLFDLLFEELLNLSKRRLGQPDVIVGGRANLLEQPEFSNISRLKALLQAFEDKKILVNLLDRCLESDSVQILIGSQGLGEMVPGCGVVVAPYADMEHPVGSIGVVGPMRMDYGRVMALVEYAAQVLSAKVKES